MEFESFKLKELVKINQQSYKKSWNWKKIYYLDTGNLTKNVIDNIGEFNPEKEKLPSRAKRVTRKNSILFSTVRPNQEHYGFVEEDYSNLLVSTGFAVIDSDKHKVNPKYLYYFLTQTKIIEYLQKIAEDSVSTYPAIKPSDLGELSINLPCLNIQDKITLLLTSIDKKIKTNTKIIENLEAQAQAIFKSWFVDFEPFQDGNFVESELGLIPEGWEVFKLEDIADISNGYSFKSRDLQHSYKNENDYRVFKQGDIKVGGGFNPDKTKSWISEKFIENNKIERFILDKNDILMCMTDMKDNVRLLGNTAYIWEENKYVLNQRVGRIRCENKKITPSFIYFLTNSQEFLNDLRGRANRGVQVNLSSKEIKKSLFVMPNKKYLNRFNKYSTLVMEMVGNLYLENYRLIKLRDTLLPKLMSGEIDVSNIKIDDEDIDYE